MMIGLGACATAPTRSAESPAPAPLHAGDAQSDEGYDDSALEVASEYGSMEQGDAEDAIHRNWSSIARCYEQATAGDYAEGDVTLRFVVRRTGVPSAVYIVKSELGNLEVERCIADAASAIRFPRPHGNGGTIFDYSMQFQSRREIPVVNLPAQTAAEALPQILGGLFADCRELGAEEVLATLYVAHAGQVRSVGFATPAPWPRAEADCVAASLQKKPLGVAVEPHTLGRLTLALRRADVANPPMLAAPTTTKPGPQIAQSRRRR